MQLFLHLQIHTFPEWSIILILLLLSIEKEGLDEEISQNNIRTRNNNWHSNIDPRPNEIG